ncbi:MAG: hypothetical protein IT210_13580 [Armatimonadetes bacterium]|nr:hypothetical protein [Armatimonadota bacterium]
MAGAFFGLFWLAGGLYAAPPFAERTPAIVENTPIEAPAEEARPAPPVLRDPGPVPPKLETGRACTFKIVYSDLTGRAPDYIRVVVDGRWHELIWSGNTPQDFIRGVTATKDSTFQRPGQHTYFFEASAGGKKVRYPASGKLAVRIVKPYVPPPPPPKPPVLTNPLPTPTTGFVKETYDFGITYSHPSNAAPDFLRVVIDGKGRPLQLPISRSQDYRSGIQAALRIPFMQTGDHKFHYEAKSQGLNVRYPPNEEMVIAIESKLQKWILFAIGAVCLAFVALMNYNIFFNVFRAPAPKAARFAILISLVLAFLLFAYLFINILGWMYIAGGAVLVVGLLFVLFTRQ